MDGCWLELKIGYTGVFLCKITLNLKMLKYHFYDAIIVLPLLSTHIPLLQCVSQNFVNIYLHSASVRSVKHQYVLQCGTAFPVMQITQQKLHKVCTGPETVWTSSPQLPYSYTHTLD